MPWPSVPTTEGHPLAVGGNPRAQVTRIDYVSACNNQMEIQVARESRDSFSKNPSVVAVERDLVAKGRPTWVVVVQAAVWKGELGGNIAISRVRRNYVDGAWSLAVDYGPGVNRERDILPVRQPE